jgi:thiol:disulfide interchange protein DsbC
MQVHFMHIYKQTELENFIAQILENGMKIFSALFLILVFSTSLYAEDPLSKVKEMQIVQDLPGQAKIIGANDLGSLYEVIISVPNHGKQVIYVTKDGAYMLMGGSLVNQDKVNLTKLRHDEIDKIEVDRLPLQEAIVISKGDGSKKLFMFTDVDCPFCKQSYTWLKNQTDYSLYVFLLPLPMHPTAYDKSVKVLCQENREASFDLASSGKDPGGEKCEKGEATLRKCKTIADELGITGTPLFITDSGTRIMGFDQSVLSAYLSKQK